MVCVAVCGAREYLAAPTVTVSVNPDVIRILQKIRPNILADDHTFLKFGAAKSPHVKCFRLLGP